MLADGAQMAYSRAFGDMGGDAAEWSLPYADEDVSRF
jgi:hypothetical protein